MSEASTPVLPERWAPRFFTIWIGQAFSLLGSALVQFALVWWLTQKTGSATVLALSTLAALLPQIVVGPFAGTLVDRWSRRVVMIVADGGIALTTVVLIYLFWSGQVQVWHIYVAMFLRSAGSAFHYPAMHAATSLMVPDRHLARVAGLNQTLQGLVSIAAPPAGAVLIGLFPTQGVLMIDVLTAAVAIAPLLVLRVPEPVRSEEPGAGDVPAPAASFLQDLRAGFSYVVGWRGLLAIMIMATMINFLINPAMSLMPLLVTKHFGRGAIDLGAMESVFGVGAIGGGLVLSAWGGFKRRIATSMSGIVGIGLGILLIGLAPAALFPLAIFGGLLMGIMVPMANGPLLAMMQATVRPDMQGRVMGLIVSAASAMSPLSLLVAGPVADRLGVRAWFWVGGGICLLMGLAGFLIPAVMNVESERAAGYDREMTAAAPAGVGATLRK